MRGNGRKTKYKKCGLLRGALHRGIAVALSVFLLAGQMDLSAYAMEDFVIQEDADTENSLEVTQTEVGGSSNDEGEGTSSENTEETQPGADDNDGEDNVQNPDGDYSPEEGNEDGDVPDGGGDEEEPEAEIPGDENPLEEAAGEAPAEPVALAEPEETTEKETRASETFVDSGFNYEIIDTDNHYVAVFHKNYSGTGPLIIPENVTYNGVSYTVTQIPENGFQYSRNVQEIVMPDSVKIVGKNAFISCDSASKITLSRNLEKIEEGAFYNCASLKTITIPGNVSVIEKEAFWSCKELTEVTLENPDNPIAYGGSVFWGCNKLPGSEIEKIITSSGMTQIPNAMFTGCNALTQITIPKNITGIGSGAFLQCQGLVKATIPSSVTEIGEMAFEQCKNLKEISMADGLTTLGYRAFLMCESLQSVVLPDTVTTVDESVFDHCNSLKSVKLSSALSAVSNYMFLACTSLEEVTIPQSVTSIGEYGFAVCPALKSVTLLSSATEINNHAFDGGKSLNELRIVVPVTEEGGQKQVTPVTVHTGWKSRNNYVFLECPQEQPLVFLSTDGVTPLAGDDLAAAVDAYKKVRDTYEYDWDNTWYGWQLPAVENPPVPPVTNYTITASATTGGRIDPNGSVTVTKGTDQTFTITPDEGYQIKSVTVDGNEVTWEEAVQTLADEDQVQTGKAGTYTFSDVQGDHVIEAAFEAVPGGNSPGEDDPPADDDKPDKDKPGDGKGDSGSDDKSDKDPVSVTVVTNNITDNSVSVEISTESEMTVTAPEKEPRTDDASHVEIYATIAMIAGFTYLLLYFIEERRGMTEREKEVFVAAFIRWAKKGGFFRKCCALVAIFCILAYYHSVGKRREEKLYPVVR